MLNIPTVINIGGTSKACRSQKEKDKVKKIANLNCWGQDIFATDK